MRVLQSVGPQDATLKWTAMTAPSGCSLKWADDSNRGVDPWGGYKVPGEGPYRGTLSSYCRVTVELLSVNVELMSSTVWLLSGLVSSQCRVTVE